MNTVLALDQGTSSCRAILFDQQAQVVGVCQEEFPQYYPQGGWVEHNPDEIWETQLRVARQVVEKYAQGIENVRAIGITNQRETTVVWNRKTGRPLAPAIVWQDRRTSNLCRAWKQQWGEEITDRTGLIVDAYFSASKISWLLDQVDGARQMAEQGELAFGTVDSWLVWKLTGGQQHVTDPSNASRTMLYNIDKRDWDRDLLDRFQIPESVLPRVCESSEIVGTSKILGAPIPIAGIAGDQQSALFGQQCFKPGLSKNTYGTGCFMLLNTGSKREHSKNQLLSTVGWTFNGETCYALEGSVFIGGAAVGWLRDGLNLIESSAEVESLARTVPDSEGVVFVPAFNGLGTPYWDQDARGTILGLTRGTTSAHLARATLEAIAFQVCDVMEAMQKDASVPLKELRVDGGAAANDLLLEIQADLLQVPVVRPKNTESTALGAAYLAGLATGFYQSLEQLEAFHQVDRVFEPQQSPYQAAEKKALWHRAVERSREWIQD